MSGRLARDVIRGVYAVTPDSTDTGRLLTLATAALEGGVRVVQYRNKSASPAAMLEQVRLLKDACSRYGAALIVNDYLDLALAADADGIHLGKEDGSCAHARNTLGPDKMIGISCYDDIDNARKAVAAGADYVAFGSFFPSRVKPGAVRAPIDLLTRARAELAVPLVAIGGITAENAGKLVRAGADAVAVISSLFDVSDVAAAARRLNASFESRS